MSNLYESHELDNKTTLDIYVDECPYDPRDDPHTSTMICFHARYILGDKHTISRKDFTLWESLERHLRNHYDAKIIKPLYLLDHGGLSISMTPFALKWDSGQLGFIYATTDLVDEWGEEEIIATLESEVTMYNQYISGDVYRYELKHHTMCEHCKHGHIDMIQEGCFYFGSNFIKNGLYADAGAQELIKAQRF